MVINVNTGINPKSMIVYISGLFVPSPYVRCGLVSLDSETFFGKGNLLRTQLLISASNDPIIYRDECLSQHSLVISVEPISAYAY